MKKIMLALVSITVAFCIQAQNPYRLQGSEVVIDQPVLFKPGTAILLPESDSALSIIKNYLTDKSYISLLRVEGHTDNSGNEAQNQQLSQQRALAICRKLVKMGVECNRLVAVGFGSTKPVAGNETAEGKAQNRRISFVNAALRGRMIGGLPADGGGQLAGDVCQ